MRTHENRRPGRVTELVAILISVVVLASACGEETESAAAEGVSGVEVSESTSDDTPLSMAEGEALTFAVEVVVVESPFNDFAVGEVLWETNCYTFHSDGTFTGPGLPDWRHGSSFWAAGTWESDSDGTTSSYVGRINASANLIQRGSITVDEATGELHLTAETSISIAGGLLIRTSATGPAVEECKASTV